MKSQSPTVTHESQNEELKECDLVMKGGITSGIVYPPLILKLKDKYRFRSIGGTSAGAIAAAVTAAAEYGRNQGGFDQLSEMSQKLGTGTFLRDLFQASPETQPVLDILLTWVASRSKESNNPQNKTLWSQLRTWITFLTTCHKGLFLKGSLWGFIWGFLAAIPLSLLSYGIALLANPLQFSIHNFWLLLVLQLHLGVPLAFIGLGIGGLYNLFKILTKTIPDKKHNFGICSGKALSRDKRDKSALTDWLHEQIQNAAGKTLDNDPLTFGDLEDEGITLKMVTSNFSQSQPYILPFEDDELFLFKKEEFEQLFSENVVNYLIDPKRQRETRNLNFGEVTKQGYYVLPVSAELPVIVATRMSLSFPLLISAVPLYTISQKFTGQKVQKQKVKKEHLQRNLFSDGGISSNFPIHFFDKWLPTRPTFAINLTSFPKQAFKNGQLDAGYQVSNLSIAEGETDLDEQQASQKNSSPQDDVYMYEAKDVVTSDWIPIDSFLGFFGAMFATAQNYRDNLQSQLPSYRERIVHIRLSKDEGGLNLTMSPKTIEAVVKKGEKAGYFLVNNFKLEHHQWVRFRVLVRLLEETLKNMNEVLSKNKLDHEQLIAEANQKGTEYPYPCYQDPQWSQHVLQGIQEIQTVVQKWQKSPIIPPHSKEPEPKPVLRVTPKL